MENRIAPPFPGRKLPDGIQVKGLDRDASGKFAALSVSIPLTDWPPSYCDWQASLLDQDDAWVAQASATVPLGQQEVTLVFDGAQISASSAVAPLRLARVQAKCQVRAGAWRILFDNNPLHRIPFSPSDFTTVPLAHQATPTGQNKFGSSGKSVGGGGSSLALSEEAVEFTAS